MDGDAPLADRMAESVLVISEPADAVVWRGPRWKARDRWCQLSTALVHW